MRTPVILATLLGVGVLTTMILRTPAEEQRNDAPPPDVGAPLESIVQDAAPPATTRSAAATASKPSPTAISEVIRRCPLNHVCLGDGGPRALRWEAPPAMPQPSRWRPPPYADALAELEPMMDAGDPSATLMVHDILETCRQAHSTEQSLSNAIDTMEQTHRLEWPGRGVFRLAESDKRAEMAQRLRETYDDCKGVPRATEADQLALLARVAEGPYSQAKMNYAEHVQDPKLKETLLRDAWKLGNQFALYGLVDLLITRYEQGLQPDAHIEAAATMLLYTALLRAEYEPNPERIAGRAVNRMLAATDARMSLLRLHEREQARHLAQTMLEQNSACCLGH
ncbi:MAG: hypothetical protein AAGA68_08435 [Pseudomonadota bacterium]